MEFLKDVLGEELYSLVEEKLKGNDKVKLVNLADGEYVSKSKYNDDIKTRDEKITELTDSVKKFDGVDVKKLQQDVDDWRKKYETEMAAERKNSAIKLAVAVSRPKNEKALMALLDTDTIKLNDDGSVTGLKEQLENIKKDNAFLFDTEPDKKDVNLGGNHEKEAENKPLTLDSAVAEHYEKGE